MNQRLRQCVLGLVLAALLPATKAAEGTNALAPAWLTEPMTLRNALEVALSQNAAILRSLGDVQAAEGLAMNVRSVVLPRLRAAAEYEHTEAVEEIPFSRDERLDSPKDEWSGTIRIRQPIYQGGRLKASWRTARLTREEALLNYYAVVADSLLEVRTAYYNILLAEQQIAVREAAVKLLSEELENTKRRFEAGTVPRFDVLRGEVEVANARPKVIRARNQYRIAKNRLATLLGYNIPVNIWEDIPMTLTDKLQAEPYSIELPPAIAQARHRRPELAALQKAVGLRKERIALAKAQSKPWLSLFAGYDGRNSQFGNDFFKTVNGPLAGLEMTWDIWDAGATRGQVMEAEAFYNKAQVALEDAIRRVEQEVRTAYSSLLEAQEVLESQLKVQERAEEALRLAVSRYDAGTGTQLDVLNAQTALTEARATQVEASRDYLVARAGMERAIGQDVPESAIKEGKK